MATQVSLVESCHANFRTTFFQAKEAVEQAWTADEASAMTESLLTIVEMAKSASLKPHYVSTNECRYHVCFSQSRSGNFHHLYQTHDSCCDWAPSGTSGTVEVSTKDAKSVDDLRLWLLRAAEKKDDDDSDFKRSKMRDPYKALEELCIRSKCDDSDV